MGQNHIERNYHKEKENNFSEELKTFIYDQETCGREKFQVCGGFFFEHFSKVSSFFSHP